MLSDRWGLKDYVGGVGNQKEEFPAFPVNFDVRAVYGYQPRGQIHLDLPQDTRRIIRDKGK